MLNKLVTRKFKATLISKGSQNFFRFDGANFKTEASSQFPHWDVWALGYYRNSPFVTGHDGSPGLTTEILDYEAEEWQQAADYPFAGSGNRYVKFILIESSMIWSV